MQHSSKVVWAIFSPRQWGFGRINISMTARHQKRFEACGLWSKCEQNYLLVSVSSYIQKNWTVPKNNLNLCIKTKLVKISIGSVAMVYIIWLVSEPAVYCMQKSYIYMYTMAFTPELTGSAFMRRFWFFFGTVWRGGTEYLCKQRGNTECPPFCRL